MYIDKEIVLQSLKKWFKGDTRMNIVTFNDVLFPRFYHSKRNHHVNYIDNGWSDAIKLAEMLCDKELPFMVIGKEIKIYHFCENGIYNDDSILLSSYELEKIDTYIANLEIEKNALKLLEKV